MIAKLVAQGLTEYGEAIRGDWSELDGRSVRGQLDYLSALLVGETGADTTIEQVRSRLGICPQGGGHWTQYCGESYTSCATKKEGD